MKKLGEKYRFAFSPVGFAGFAAIMLPNIIWMIRPPENDPIAANSSGVAAVDIAMSAAQWIMIAMLILLNSNDGAKEFGRLMRCCAAVCAVCAVIYYVSWICCYSGISSPAMFIGMAVEPSLFFISLAVLLRNYPVLPPALVFAVLHTYVTARNFG